MQATPRAQVAAERAQPAGLWLQGCGGAVHAERVAAGQRAGLVRPEVTPAVPDPRPRGGFALGVGPPQPPPPGGVGVG